MTTIPLARPPPLRACAPSFPRAGYSCESPDRERGVLDLAPQIFARLDWHLRVAHLFAHVEAVGELAAEDGQVAPLVVGLHHVPAAAGFANQPGGSFGDIS